MDADPSAPPPLGEPSFPLERVRTLVTAPVRPGGDFVLYWMSATRRPNDSFALERAAAWARALNRPLLVLETLSVDEPWASERSHAFTLRGMAANARAFEARGVRYHPWVEPRSGASVGLLASLASRACVVVCDESVGPSREAAPLADAAGIPVRVERVDDQGLLPLSATDRAAPSAAVFRRWLQRGVPTRIGRPPEAAPRTEGLPSLPTLPAELRRRWPAASPGLLAVKPAALAALPLDHGVPPVGAEGGWERAGTLWRHFRQDRLPAYDRARNVPGTGSGLSPYLNTGHISAWRLVGDLLAERSWDPADLGPARGQRAGWWGVDAGAEAFLDQLVTWRELCLHAAWHDPAYFSYEGLPAWARASLEARADDPRPWRYELSALEDALTHDSVWNAAQRQLRAEGGIDGYPRMIWGKRLLEWTSHPRQAWERLHAVNDRWALDGRSPTGTGGIAWTLGRFDRPWAPQRPVFGAVRFMSSERARRKLPLDAWLTRWGG